MGIIGELGTKYGNIAPPKPATLINPITNIQKWIYS
jgi:hypothetical protein